MAQSAFSKEYAHFRAVLRAARKNAQLTQRDVETRLDLYSNFVSKVETGERRLDVIEFLALAKALDIDPVEIIKELQETFPQFRGTVGTKC